jgi:hypothetical protein
MNRRNQKRKNSIAQPQRSLDFNPPHHKIRYLAPTNYQNHPIYTPLVVITYVAQ